MEAFPPDLFLGIEVATVVATAVILIHVVQWTFTQPWWVDTIGTTLVLKDIALLGILVPSSLNVLFPGFISPLAEGWIDLITLGAISVIMAWRAVVWWRIKKPTLEHVRWALGSSIGSPVERLRRLLDAIRGVRR